MAEIYDVIIIGTGIAGLSAGIMLHDSGLKVLLISKEERIEETATNYAQGGIIAWKKGDTMDSLKTDILKAGHYYNNNEAVDKFSQYGPQLVFDFLIKEMGIKFSKGNNGELDYTEEAAHSTPRILHFQDHTGDTIQAALINNALKRGITIINNHTSIDLITNNHHSRNTQERYKPRIVMGVYALDNDSGNIERYLANKVILATGGIGNIYQHTTNPVGETGDGLCMAYRAGADIINSEFVQFHPTSLFHREIKRFLISESLRGEGGKLLDHQGRQFMQDYSPMVELAPRDVVARAIYKEMNKSGKQFMFLDIANHYKGSIPIKERFSKIYSTCLKGGIDLTREPIPVVPAAHYFCGGIKVDLSGRSSLENLYAIGEVSCTGLHGANRLASTSLLEGLIWANFCCQDIVKSIQPINQDRFATIPDWFKPSETEHFDNLLINQDMQVIQTTMWNYAGIIRTRKGLERAKSDINYHSYRIFKFYKSSALKKDIIQLRNAVVTASIVINAAIHNRKSIGCHYIENQ